MGIILSFNIIYEWTKGDYQVSQTCIKIFHNLLVDLFIFLNHWYQIAGKEVKFYF